MFEKKFINRVLSADYLAKIESDIIREHVVLPTAIGVYSAGTNTAIHSNGTFAKADLKIKGNEVAWIQIWGSGPSGGGSRHPDSAGLNAEGVYAQNGGSGGNYMELSIPARLLPDTFDFTVAGITPAPYFVEYPGSLQVYQNGHNGSPSTLQLIFNPGANQTEILMHAGGGLSGVAYGGNAANFIGSVRTPPNPNAYIDVIFTLNNVEADSQVLHGLKYAGALTISNANFGTIWSTSGIGNYGSEAEPPALQFHGGAGARGGASGFTLGAIPSIYGGGGAAAAGNGVVANPKGASFHAAYGGGGYSNANDHPSLTKPGGAGAYEFRRADIGGTHLDAFQCQLGGPGMLRIRLMPVGFRCPIGAHVDRDILGMTSSDA